MKLIPVAILLVFCSCSIQRRIYSTTQINNPSLEKKNDHAFSLSYSGPSGFDLTGGYAVTNHFALIAGAYTYRNSDKQTADDPFSNYTATAGLLYRHKGFHGGLGFYFPFSGKNANLFASFFTGYTKGNFTMDEHRVETNTGSGTSTPADYFYKSDIGRYFIQGGVNAYLTECEVSLLLRYTYVTYSNVVTNYSSADQSESHMPPVGYSKISQFLDIGLDAKYFFTKEKRLGVQLFAAVAPRLNPQQYNFDYYPFRAGIGIVMKNPFHKK